jgi:hypothetical protein
MEGIMATLPHTDIHHTEPGHWYDLTTHHRWEDIGSLAIAALVLLAPMFFAETAETYEPTVYLITGAIAAFIAAVAMLEAVSLSRWEEVLELIAGICLAGAPFVLGYGGPLATWHMAGGILVAILALLELWQDSRQQYQ